MNKFFPKIVFITSLYFLLFPVVSFAQVVINEVMYSPSSKQWVEIYNNTDSDVDLTQYKILDSGASVNGHGISAFVSNNNMLPAHGYAVVAKVPTDFSLSNLFKSSLGIKTTGDTITLKNGSDVVDSVSFSDGAANSGDSLQKYGSNWISALPTPGQINATEPTIVDTTDTSDDTSNPSGEVLGDSTGSSSSVTQQTSGSGNTTNVSSPSAQLEVSAGSNRTTFPGSPIWFQATIKKNSTLTGIELDWSFGDGDVGTGPLVSHTYKYPGDFVVVLSAKAADIFSISRLNVKVVDSDLSVSDGGQYLEISNNSDAEINLFNWKIENNGKGFVFQPNTIILPNSSVKFDKSLLKMKGLDNSLGISLKNSMGQEVFAIAPIKEVDLVKASEDLQIMEQQFSTIQQEANNLNLVSQNNDEDINISNNVGKKDEPQADLADATNTDNVIYESPKELNFFGKVWNFVSGLFD